MPKCNYCAKELGVGGAKVVVTVYGGQGFLARLFGRRRFYCSLEHFRLDANAVS